MTPRPRQLLEKSRTSPGRSRHVHHGSSKRTRVPSRSAVTNCPAGSSEASRFISRQKLFPAKILNFVFFALNTIGPFWRGNCLFFYFFFFSITCQKNSKNNFLPNNCYFLKVKILLEKKKKVSISQSIEFQHSSIIDIWYTWQENSRYLLANLHFESIITVLKLDSIIENL